MPLHRRDVERRRQVVDHRVEQRLHALVLERRAAEHRARSSCASVPLRSAARISSSVIGFAVEVLLHQLLVELGDRLDQLLARRAAASSARSRRDRPRSNFAPSVLVVPDDRLHLDEVDDAAEARPRRRSGAGAATGLAPQALADHVRRTRSKSAPTRSILLTNAMRGTLVLVGLAPDRLGLRLDAADRRRTPRPRRRARAASARPRSVKSTWPGRVDDVDAVVAPEAGGRGGGDGDAALLLLLHPVHGGGALVDLADLVGDAGVEEDPLGGRGLAGIDVGHDADVAGALERDVWRERIPTFSDRVLAPASLPAVVGEGLVGLRHLVRVFASS